MLFEKQEQQENFLDNLNDTQNLMKEYLNKCTSINEMEPVSQNDNKQILTIDIFPQKQYFFDESNLYNKKLNDDQTFSIFDSIYQNQENTINMDLNQHDYKRKYSILQETLKSNYDQLDKNKKIFLKNSQRLEDHGQDCLYKCSACGKIMKSHLQMGGHLSQLKRKGYCQQDE